MTLALGAALILIGLFGCYLHISHSGVRGLWVGTSHEALFLVGTALALVALSAGIMVLSGTSHPTS